MIQKKYSNLSYHYSSFDQPGRVFVIGPGDWGSISGRVILKTQKLVLDTSLLNAQHYKVRFQEKSGAIQGKEKRTSLHLGVVVIEKEAFRFSPRLRSPTFFVSSVSLYIHAYIFLLFLKNILFIYFIILFYSIYLFILHTSPYRIRIIDLFDP